MNVKLNQKSINNNNYSSNNPNQSITSNKIKINSLSPDLGQIPKTKFIEYVNKKLITKSEDLKQTQITKTKNSYNSSFTGIAQNKVKPSLANTLIGNSNHSSNNLNPSTSINNYITSSKHNPISLISSNFTNNSNSSFSLKNSLNLGTQKLNQTLMNSSNIPIFINPTTSGDNFKILTKKFHSKDKTFVGNINDPRFSNLETSDQEDELKLIASKKSEIEKKIFLLKKQVKTKSRSTNTKIGINKSTTSTNNNNNNFNFATNNDSFCNNLKTETINDKIIQNTFIQDTNEERKMTEYFNNRNNNDTFFSNTDFKSTNNNQLMIIDTQLIPDEIFHNDKRYKDLLDKYLSLDSDVGIIKKNNQDLNCAVKILVNYIQSTQNSNISKGKEKEICQEKTENENKRLNDENGYLHKLINDLKLKILKMYQTLQIYESKNNEERNEMNKKITQELLRENHYLRRINEKTVFNNYVVEKEHRSNSENSKLIKSNDEIIQEYKKNRKRNQSELNFEYLNNSSMNNSIINENSNSRINKFMFTKKDFLFEELNSNKSINTNEINLNSIKYSDSIKNINPSSNDLLKNRKQYLFLKTPKGLSNL